MYLQGWKASPWFARQAARSQQPSAGKPADARKPKSDKPWKFFGR
jgi:hypothetical protein